MSKLWSAESITNDKIACFDVYYYTAKAKAGCIVFEIEPNENEKIVSQYTQMVESVNDYISGEFYKRELPCLLAVSEKIQEDIGLIIVDGYVWLDSGRKGLGGHFFEALPKKIPVVGVAKTLYKSGQDYLKVYRGQSSRPLYVSSIGIDLNSAAALIKNLKGENRLPDIIKKVDQLTRL